MSAAPEAVPKTNDNLSQGLVLQLVPVLDQVGVRLVELEYVRDRPAFFFICL